MQFTQLLFINRARSAGEQALGALRLREGDHIANGGCTRHHRDDTVQTEGDAAVRRRTVLQGVKQEAELKLGFFRTNLQCAEDLALNIGTVDTDGTATDFPAVQNHVVGLGVAVFGIGFEQIHAFVLGRGERMVAGHPTIFLFGVFEEETKYEKYGQRFLTAIREYREEHGDREICETAEEENAGLPETEPQKGAFDRTEYNRAHNRPAGAGRTWDAAEDEELKREFDSGMKIAEIARQHDRTYGAIQARLKKQGLVE